MAQFKQADITNVYWASNDGFKGGRDPMGIQNSSVATYGKLLPGMTNLTGHIRYYSLYCWLLDEYDQLDKKESQSVHQYNFIRRSELTMALMMKDKGVRSVVGALFVAQGNYKFVEDGVYDLASGADFDSETKYWSFVSGALGQYYLGSLVYYELVKVEESRFYLGEKGKQLATAFRNSVDEDVRNLFVECLLDGNVSEEELEEFSPLALNKIEVDSEEWLALNNLLTKVDSDGSNLRQQSVLLMLQDLDKGVSVDDFTHHRFLHVADNKDNQAVFGWYFYYLCEALHYCIESIFCLILNNIDDLQNPPVSVLIEDIQNKILACTVECLQYDNMEDWRLHINDKIDDLQDEMKASISNREYVEASSNAIKLLLRLATEYYNDKDSIRTFEDSHDLTRQRGILSEGVKAYVTQHLTSSVQDYIKAIILQIMQEHTIVAIGKMGNSNSDLRKFIMEDGRVVLVEIRYPSYTTPRIKSLFNYLQDLGYLDQDGNLTQIAYDYIENHESE